MEAGGVTEEFSSLLRDASELVLQLKSEDRLVRRDSLKNFATQWNKYSDYISEDNCASLFESIYKTLLLTLRDPVEKCRELSAGILLSFVDKKLDDEFLPFLVSTLVVCLASADEREISEEVRLIQLKLLNAIVQTASHNVLSKHLNDIVHILSKCIVDLVPEIKRLSCNCAADIAYKLRAIFHMVSSSLVNPLLLTLTHQHYRTRVACIEALGTVIQYGNNENVKEVLPHLAQRLFDLSPAVRIAIARTIGTWLIDLPDRYSFFPNLLPLLLSLLSDNVPEVRLKAEEFWSQAGEVYLEENKKHYKDQMDFPKPVSECHPGCQPSLGCRVLVQRYFSTIVPVLLRDVGDWLLDTRLKSVQLLYMLLLHCEEKATMKVQLFLQGIILSVKDEDKETIETGLKTAELLGFFIESKIWSSNILPLVCEKPTSCHLAVLAALIRGNGRKELNDCFSVICETLSDPTVCQIRKPKEQANCLLCVEALLLYHKADSSSYELFVALVSIASLTELNAILEQVKKLLQLLCSSQSFSSILDLYAVHSCRFLQEIVQNHEVWSIHSPEIPIFIFLVEQSCSLKDVALLCIPYIILNLSVKNDPKLRSNFLSLTTTVLKQIPKDPDYDQHVFNLVHKGLFPNLVWSAGQTAAALRTIAVANFSIIIASGQLQDSMLCSLSDELLPILKTLADDDEGSNRLLGCRILEQIIPVILPSVDEHGIHNIIQEYLSCLDDELDEVRIAATKVCKSYFKSFTKEYNWAPYSAHLQHLYRNVLIHMDDGKEVMRMAAYDLLKEVSFASPEILLTEIDAVKHMMNASDLCDSLEQNIKKLVIDNI